MSLSRDEILAGKILIVDDQEANVLLLEQLLQEAGYTAVSSTRDPHEVCALYRKHRYDLVLLDLQMPGMDGFQVLSGLLANAESDYLPVLVLTAQPGHKQRALDAGAKDFISKPFDLVEVKTRIQNMLEVRLLYRKLEERNACLEVLVNERTAELRESEARYRGLTELAADWFWEQDESGRFTKVSGPVLEMLGMAVEPFVGEAKPPELAGWDAGEQALLRAKVEARMPFLDLVLSRTDDQGLIRRYRISGQPMFSMDCRYLGYRGIGVMMLGSSQAAP